MACVDPLVLAFCGDEDGEGSEEGLPFLAGVPLRVIEYRDGEEMLDEYKL